MASGYCALHALRCFIGITSPLNIILLSEDGLLYSNPLRVVTIHNADTAHIIVVTFLSSRKSRSFVGNEKHILGISCKVAPVFKLEYISLTDTSKSKGA